MKKFLASSLIMALSFPAFSSSSMDQHLVVVENNEVRDAFSLNAETFRTEYRTERVERTCYRQVIVGYERICNRYLLSNQIIAIDDKAVGPHPAPGPQPRDPGRTPKPGPRPEPRPRPQPRPEPRPYPRPPICHDEPIYRTVAYSCMETISVPYEVFDHRSTANINVRVSAAPVTKPQTQNCGINFRLEGDSLEAKNTCVDYLAYATKTVEGYGDVKNYNYSINLYDAHQILAPLVGRLQDMHVNGNELIVKTGKLVDPSKFKLSLFVQRRRLFKSDAVLIDRVLLPGEFFYEATDERTGNVHINLNKVTGGLNFSKKHIIKLKLDVLVNVDSGELLNRDSIPSLHQEASITIN